MNEGPPKDYKLVVFGAAQSGKSAVTVQFVQNTFITGYDPTIENSYQKKVKIDNCPVCRLNILDTAGTEQFHAMRQLYTSAAQGFLLVYSVTSRESLAEINSYLESIHISRPAGTVPIVLCGNKCDVEDAERQVTRSEGENLAKSIGCPFFETSAKTSVNVESAFFELVREIDRTSP
ncbi:Ras GTPase [Pelomyxa schiedti]|nr:Ras GTPase [Pelomyxa schiedti]